MRHHSPTNLVTCRVRRLRCWAVLCNRWVTLSILNLIVARRRAQKRFREREKQKKATLEIQVWSFDKAYTCFIFVEPGKCCCWEVEGMENIWEFKMALEN